MKNGKIWQKAPKKISQVNLMDTHFLIELQNYLHRVAGEQGVDTSNHGEWDRWLGNVDAPTCDVRMKGRGRIEPKG